jgi:hypothetical protein
LFEDGQLRKFVNIYVNDEDIRYLGRLDAELKDGDVVSILPAVAGGSLLTSEREHLPAVDISLRPAVAGGNRA